MFNTLLLAKEIHFVVHTALVSRVCNYNTSKTSHLGWISQFLDEIYRVLDKNKVTRCPNSFSNEEEIHVHKLLE